MNIDEYQEKAASTAVYPKEVKGIYPALGLAGEAGEFCEKLSAFLFPEGKPKEQTDRFVWSALESAAGSGKVCETIKKMLRGDSSGNLNLNSLKERFARLTSKQLEELEFEAFDVLWYISANSTDQNRKMSDGAKNNLNKLFNRKEKGTLQSDGDKR